MLSFLNLLRVILILHDAPGYATIERHIPSWFNLNRKELHQKPARSVRSFLCVVRQTPAVEPMFNRRNRVVPPLTFSKQ